MKKKYLIYIYDQGPNSTWGLFQSIKRKKKTKPENNFLFYKTLSLIGINFLFIIKKTFLWSYLKSQGVVLLKLRSFSFFFPVLFNIIFAFLGFYLRASVV